MIATTAMHDVIDVEGFVAAQMRRSGISFGRDERDELLAEGLAIMVELADRYEAHRPGYTRPGSFAGYAAQILPRRLRDAWMRLHPEHVERRHGNRRIVDWGDAPSSLDADDAPVVAVEALDPTLRLHDHADSDVAGIPLAASALSLLRPHERLVARPIIGHLVDRRGVDEIAARMGLTRGQVGGVRERFELAIRQAQADAQEAEAA